MIKVVDGVAVETTIEEDIIMGLLDFINNISNKQMYEITLLKAKLEAIKADMSVGQMMTYIASNWVNDAYNRTAMDRLYELFEKIDGDISMSSVLEKQLTARMNAKHEHDCSIPERELITIPDSLEGFNF